MLHGMSPNGIGLANTALVVSVIRGPISKGLIDRAEARLWLNNAATLIEEDKTAFTKSRGEAITIPRGIGLALGLRLLEPPRKTRLAPIAAGFLLIQQQVVNLLLTLYQGLIP